MREGRLHGIGVGEGVWVTWPRLRSGLVGCGLRRACVGFWLFARLLCTGIGEAGSELSRLDRMGHFVVWDRI